MRSSKTGRETSSVASAVWHVASSCWIHNILLFNFYEQKSHWMVNWFQHLNQLNFVWRHTKVFMQNSFQWCLRNIELMRTTVNWCWWRFTRTFCHSSNILGCTHCFWLFTLWFIDEDTSFFHFFNKITNILSWWCFSSFKIRTQFSHTFCNITMIFKVMSQYFSVLFKRIHNHIRLAEGSN